jgi:NAD(P)-dependent dehydrogenase (short-subunit alcohol dehydrogenase family)
MYPMTRALEGKIAVVTGGSTGIGLATTEKLIAEGAFVFITGRRQPELDAAVSRIGATSSPFKGIRKDDIDLPFCALTVAYSRSRSARLETSPAVA